MTTKRSPQVKINPSAELVAEATSEVVVTDARGRRITLAKPGVLAQFRLVKMLGQTAENQTYVQMVLPMLFVRAIDDDPVMFPASEAEIEALITRLDDDGLTAVMEGVQANFAVAADQEAAAAQVKP